MYVPFQREGRHFQKHDDVRRWMLAIQVAGGQAGDASNKGSKVSSVFTDSARCGNGHIWGSSPNAFDHDMRKKFSLSVRSVSEIAGNRIRIITAALLKLATLPMRAAWRVAARDRLACTPTP